jgi:hypothetical protein
MCVCIIEFVVVLFTMLSCNALSVVSGMCLFADILNNTTTNSIIHTHIKIHVLTILYIYIYIYINILNILDAF